MKKKVVFCLLIIVLIIITTCQHSYAINNYTDGVLYYKDTVNGILAYKQINALKMTLSDGTVLEDATLSTSSAMDIEEILKKLEIVFVIDTSGSMSGGKEETTKNSTKKLVETLYDKLVEDESNNTKLGIGVIYFNSGMKEVLDMSYNKQEILNQLDKIYASGGTKMADSLQKAKTMLTSTPSGENILKIVCTLSDGALSDENESIANFKEIHNEKISTMSIFVDTPVTSAFSILQSQNSNYHKNLRTTEANLEKTIVDDIYNEIYMKVILYSDPTTVYNLGNAAIIPGDNKVLFQVDEEIMHGATIEIEYIISLVCAFETTNIKIADFYTNALMYNENKKMLMEDRTNKDYGWKVQNGYLLNDSGNVVIQPGKEYKIKLVLSTVLTPTVLRDFEKLENYVMFSLDRIKDGNIVENIQIVNNNTSTKENKIKSLDVLIIPPTGTSNMAERIVWTCNVTIVIVSILLIIVCIIDYVKGKVKKK